MKRILIGGMALALIMPVALFAQEGESTTDTEDSIAPEQDLCMQAEFRLADGSLIRVEKGETSREVRQRLVASHPGIADEWSIDVVRMAGGDCVEKVLQEGEEGTPGRVEFCKVDGTTCFSCPKNNSICRSSLARVEDLLEKVNEVGGDAGATSAVDGLIDDLRGNQNLFNSQEQSVRQLGTMSEAIQNAFAGTGEIAGISTQPLRDSASELKNLAGQIQDVDNRSILLGGAGGRIGSGLDEVMFQYEDPAKMAEGLRELGSDENLQYYFPEISEAAYASANAVNAVDQHLSSSVAVSPSPIDSGGTFGASAGGSNTGGSQNTSGGSAAGSQSGIADASSPYGDTDRVRNAIGKIESSNNHGAIGPETCNRHGCNRPIGRYQVMEYNIGPWTEEVLGYEMTTDQFLNDPAAQDQVFDGIFGRFANECGSYEGAAAKWFSGSCSVSARQDVLGTSVGQYVQKFSSALGSAITDPVFQRSATPVGGNTLSSSLSVTGMPFGMGSSLPTSANIADSGFQMITSLLGGGSSGGSPILTGSGGSQQPYTTSQWSQQQSTSQTPLQQATDMFGGGQSSSEQSSYQPRPQTHSGQHFQSALILIIHPNTVQVGEEVRFIWAAAGVRGDTCVVLDPQGGLVARGVSGAETLTVADGIIAGRHTFRLTCAPSAAGAAPVSKTAVLTITE